LVDAAQPTPAPAQPLVRARQLLGEERFAEALEHLAPALATDRDARLLSAIAYMHTGRFVDAEAACRQVLEGGELAGAHYVLALCRESAGDNVGAVSHAQLASVLDPSFAMARLHLGLLARRAGDRRTAGDQLARAIVLLERETPDRLELYGGGFGRRALVEMCRAELAKAAS
jgi:chemotaxis protein methyltransferase CheR